MEVSDEGKVSIVAYKLRGGVGAWWQNLREEHYRLCQPPVRDWPLMKELLQQRFLPRDYTQNLYRQLLDCYQGNRSVAEYTEEFLRLTARCSIREDDESKCECDCLSISESDFWNIISDLRGE